MLSTFLAFSLAILSASPAWCADAKKQLQGITREIREKKQLITKTAEEENRVSGELARIDKRLKEKEASLVSLKQDLKMVEGGLEKTRSEIDGVQREAESRKLLIQKRLVSVYKGGEAGTLRFLFSSESFPQMLENQRYMRSLLESDRKLLSAYEDRIEKLRQLKRQMEYDARRKESLKGSIELTKRQIEEEKSSKTSFLARVREEKIAYQASLKELEANSRRLQATIARLEAQSRRNEAAKRRAAAVAASRSQNKAGNKKRAGAPPGGLARAEGRTNDRSHDTPSPVALPPVTNGGFAAQKGRLSMPTQGRVIGSFGRHKHPEFNSFTVSNGISISAPSGADVRAVYDGRVVFSDYFKGYGNMVIVDHGDGFFSLYAHNSRLFKRAGASVSKNEVLASVGDVDSSKGPLLYFEIRYQGKPVDPAPWVR
ncbi:MAG: peptidoglycan DD-metalloendopeptidase family protein [Geobacteraceae bacterium]|nr:peptidoglycan DD-metalloendopeptidase family protein [Geobacteraceae bacterium]